MKPYQEYKTDKFVCPHCGRMFFLDEKEFKEVLVGYVEYYHKCSCGKTVRYYEVYEFSHYEVYKD